MSKSSQRRNGGETGKSFGKASSQGANSFAQASRKSGAGDMAKTAQSANTTGNAGPNIVIDIESESLTYN